MRIVFAFLIITAAAISTPVRAGNDLTAFPLSYEECAVVGDITFGQNGRWAHCHVTNTGWFATIGFLDIYQTQYCLGKKAGTCDQRAQLLFANRAYTPDARLLLQRVDPGDTEYDAPLIVDTEQGVIMMQATRTANATEPSAAVLGEAGVRSYYFWQADRWLPIDAQAWLRDLAQHLPAGAVVRTEPWPDIETMSAHAQLYRAGDADCCPSGGVADISLALSEGRFVIRNVKILPNVQ